MVAFCYGLWKFYLSKWASQFPKQESAWFDCECLRIIHKISSNRTKWKCIFNECTICGQFWLLNTSGQDSAHAQVLTLAFETPTNRSSEKSGTQFVHRWRQQEMSEVAVLTRYSDLVMIQYCQNFHCVGFAVKFQEAGDGFGARFKNTSYTDHNKYHM